MPIRSVKLHHMCHPQVHPVSISFTSEIFTKQLLIQIGCVACQQAHHLRHSRSHHLGRRSVPLRECLSGGIQLLLQNLLLISKRPKRVLRSLLLPRQFVKSNHMERQLPIQSKSGVLSSSNILIGCVPGTLFLSQGLFSGLKTGD
jgi:hypothetical protein